MNDGYNATEGGKGKGKLSDETKQKISKGNLGKTITEETRKRLSESHKGYNVSNATREKLRIVNIGKTLSEAHKNKIRLFNLGNHHSIETKLKITNKKLKYNYKIKSPIGEIFETTNLTQFSKLNNLNIGHMATISSTRNIGKKSYKKWIVIDKIPL